MAKNRTAIDNDKMYTLNKKEMEQEFRARRERFVLPRDFKIRFPIILFCKCCHTLSMVFVISFFDNYCVCNCPKCGGRHTISEGDLNLFRKLVAIVAVILVLIVLLLLLILL